MELHRPGILHRVESTKIGKAALPAENVLDDMSVEEQWAELILKEA